MAKKQTYKAFTVRPSHVLDLNGVLLDSAPLISQLAVEVRNLSAYANFVARNDTEPGSELAKSAVSQPAEAGRLAGIKIPDFLVPDKKDENGSTLIDKKTGTPIKIKTGRSCKEKLIQHNAVTAYRSWQEHVKAANRKSPNHIGATGYMPEWVLGYLAGRIAIPLLLIFGNIAALHDSTAAKTLIAICVVLIPITAY